MGAFQIKPGQEPAHLEGINIDDIIRGFWPAETVFFQALMPETKTVAIPEHDFNDFALPVAKGEEMAGKGVEFKIVGHDGAEAVDRHAHISGAHGQIDLGRVGQQIHGRPPRALTARVKASGLKPLLSLMTTPATSTSRPESLPSGSVIVIVGNDAGTGTNRALLCCCCSA